MATELKDTLCPRCVELKQDSKVTWELEPDRGPRIAKTWQGGNIPLTRKREACFTCSKGHRWNGPPPAPDI